jgi:hypothetical protein
MASLFVAKDAETSDEPCGTFQVITLILRGSNEHLPILPLSAYDERTARFPRTKLLHG